MSFAEKAIKYFSKLNPHLPMPEDIGIMNPYNSPETRLIVQKFFNQFYNDDNKRIFVFGINPGRFGGGLTGISFTDPVTLREECGIENRLGDKKELSSKFIYNVIDAFGGVSKFFSSVFLTTLYPFAIIKDGKNYNYYDEKSLAEKLKPCIVKNIKTQIGFGARMDIVILIGKKNTEYFSDINKEHKFFKKIITLEHPRFIMQYRLKKKEDYIRKYLSAIKN